MSNKFAVCPTCGAVSVAGEPCEYCGTPIVVKEDTATYEERIVPKRTIHPVAFAQKVSVFKEVGEYICNCAVVSMGGLKGLINLNGDFIFPLEYGEIKIYPCGIVYFQKGSDRYLFELVFWERIDFDLKVVSETSEWVNVPEKVERKLFEDKTNDDYCYFFVVAEYNNKESVVTALYDKDYRLIATGTKLEKVRGGLILKDNLYFDFSTRRPYKIKRTFDFNSSTSLFLSFVGRDGVLHIKVKRIPGDDTYYALNIEGMTAEEIQDEIAKTEKRAYDEEYVRLSKINRTGCYVATAVYGSYDCPEVWTLRRYRDNMLNKTWYGRAFVKCYYAISPTLVRWFGQTSWFRRMWKAPLDRIVMNRQSKGVQDTPYDDLY